MSKTTEYIKSKEELPKEFVPVWVRVCGRRPCKMYLVGKTFFYYNKTLRGCYANVSEKVIWRYCK